MAKFYFYIALINTFDLLAILAGKMWSITYKPFYLVFCSLGFAIAGFFFALALKYEGSAVTNVLWIAISVGLVTIMGYFVFKEHISGWQFLGIATVLLGIVFLNIK
ncbi:EamA family transporter [Patescibacteria group bacterium]|nr:EamA family transporter [Patescibacteria group bacterium]MBU1683161.1 EamA family transporter [Patescibacteria group bacterium]MBU1935292.1 EamA family transporter [Patescibacteria group bacterium]